MLLLLGILSITALAAFGRRENADTQIVQATGRVRLVGSSPLTSLVLSGEEREWYIDEKETEKIRPFQQQLITVQGKEYFHDLTFVNGRSAGRRYYLSDIKIIQTLPEN